MGGAVCGRAVCMVVQDMVWTIQRYVQLEKHDVKDFLIKFECLVSLTNYDLSDENITALLQVNMCKDLADKIFNTGIIPDMYKDWKRWLIVISDATLCQCAHYFTYN